MFSRTVRSSMRPCVRRFSGQNATPCAVATRGFRIVTRFPSSDELPGVGTVGAEEQARKLRSSRSQQSCQSDDLAAVQREVERRDRPLSADRCGFEHGRRRLERIQGHTRLPFERFERLDLPAEHPGDELDPAQLGLRPLADQLAVPQNGDAVGDLEDLVQEVRDEHDRDPLGRQLPDQVEEPLDLAGVEARRRLVEDQHVGRDVDRARDRDHLLHRERVRRQESRHVGVNVDARERLGGLAAHHTPLDPPPAARLAADVDVLRHREVRTEVHFLVDGADAPALRLERAAEENALALELDRAAVELVRARQDLEQGRLAGAVLPEQRVHLAGPQAEVDSVERLHAREGLVDAGHLEDRRGGGGGGGHLVSLGPLSQRAGSCLPTTCSSSRHDRNVR